MAQSNIAEIVAAMPAGSWHELPSTNMSAVFPPKEGHPGWGVEGPASIVADWGGAAFDTDRNVLVITGGGHAAYGGNEIYEFSLSDLKWDRATDPSAMVQDPKSSDPNYVVTTDGSRVSSHTYDGLQYVPPLKALFLWGGAQYKHGNNSDAHAYLFGLQSRKWQRRAQAPSTWIQPATAWDSKRNRVLTVYKTGLYAYDPAADKWSTVDSNWFFQVGRTAAYSPDHDVFFMLGDGSNKKPAAYIDFGKSNDLLAAPITGDYPTFRVGLVYCPTAKQFVAWAGDATVWTIDPVTWVCIKHTAELPGPSVTGADGKPKNHGTYSRWQYAPDYDVFIGYNSTDDNVWLYKLGNGNTVTVTPPPVDAPAPDVLNVGPTRALKTPSAAAAVAKEGDTVLIDAGEYTDGCTWPVSVTIKGMGGRPVIGGAVVESKGVWITRGKTTVIENVTLQGALGGTSNAAAIRHEGKALTLRNCEITDCHNGILVGHDPEMTVEIHDTHFHHMWTRGDLAHNIYVGKIGKLVVEGCFFEDGQSGHFIKTLAEHSRIAYNRIIQDADLDAALIDIWGCSEFEVIGNAMMRPGRYGAIGFIQITPRISEGKTIPCPDSRTKAGLVAYNTAFFNNDLHDDPRWASLVHYNYPTPNVTVTNNIVVHCNQIVWDDKNYGFAAQGGLAAGNYFTKAWASDLFADPGAGDLRLTRLPLAAVPMGNPPDRQIALPIGTVPRADASCVGAFASRVVVPPVDPPADPPALQPGTYVLAPGKYAFEVSEA